MLSLLMELYDTGSGFSKGQVQSTTWSNWYFLCLTKAMWAFAITWCLSSVFQNCL